MPITSKRWGKGTLTTSPATLATMSSEAGVGLQIRLYNGHGSAVTVALEADDQPIPLEIPAGGSAVVNLPDLPDATTVTGSASVTAVVDYLVTGGSQT